MHRVVLLVALLLTSAFVSLASGSVAQDAEPAAGLYFTNTVEADTAAGTKQLSMTDQAPQSEDAEKAYIATGLFALTYTTQFNFEAPVAFQLAGMVRAHFFLSCDQPTAYRPGSPAAVSLRVILMKDGTAINQADVSDVPSPCSGTSSVREVDAEVDSADTEFEAGDTVNVQILVWAASAPQSVMRHVHILVNSTAYPSGIYNPGLPLPGAPPEAPGVQEPVWKTVADPILTVNASFTEPTSVLRGYNWTQNTSRVVVEVSGDVANGSVVVSVADAAGAEQATLSFTSGQIADNATLEASSGGNWTVSIQYSEFVGNLTLAMRPAPQQSPSAGSPLGGNATGNQTAAPQESADAGLPGLGTMAILVALGAVVAVARRRQR